MKRSPNDGVGSHISKDYTWNIFDGPEELGYREKNTNVCRGKMDGAYYSNSGSFSSGSGTHEHVNSPEIDEEVS